MDYILASLQVFYLQGDDDNLDHWEESYGHLQPSSEDMRDYFNKQGKNLRICPLCLRSRNCREGRRWGSFNRSWKNYRNAQYKGAYNNGQ